MVSDILMGNKLYLDPMKDQTYPLLVNWLSDSNIIKYLDSSECRLSLEKIKILYSINDEKNKLFTIIKKIKINQLEYVDYKKLIGIKKMHF